ncbi:MAG: energy transducer TonB [Pseudomonadota bacterium]
MDRTLKTAIIISLAVHLAVIASLIISPWLFSKDMPGPGGEVHVWIEVQGAAKGVGIGSGNAAVTKKFKKKIDDGMRVAGDLAMAPLKRSEIPETDKNLEASGGGKGLGSGGINVGKGGDPLLAKIWRQINSSKYYPSSARRKGITGAPQVSFAINEDGKIKWVKLAASCSAKVLDDAALETVRRAAPLPFYPKPITVVVKYSLTQ